MKASVDGVGESDSGCVSFDSARADITGFVGSQGRWIRLVLLGLMGIFPVGVVSLAPAARVKFGFDFDFSATEPGTAPPCSECLPWLEVELTDISPNLVTLTIAAVHLTEPEHLKDLYLNVNPSYDPSLLSFASPTVQAGSFELPAVNAAANAYKADDDGNYDIHFSFITGSGPTDQFEFGDVLSYQVSLTGGGTLTAADFSFLSAPNPESAHGPFLAAAHVVSTGPAGEQSSWIAPIPEPRALWLGAGAMVLMLRRRR